MMTMTLREQNELVKQYTPLVNKMIMQFYKKNTTSWENLKSMALEGLALAFKNYDPKRSKMNFTQFAAFAIRNNILTGLDNELRVVKLSAYAQKKVAEKGDALWNTVRVNMVPSQSDNENKKPLEIKLGMYENEKFSDGDVLGYLCIRVESQFTEEFYKAFYMKFGLNGFEEMKGCEIAKEIGVSEAQVSQRVKKVIEWIRKDNELCEVLSNLL